MADPGTRLAAALADRYRLEGELGSGGMATVYLAEDVKHHRRVAIKVLKPELAAVLGAERFVQEIETTAALNHPHILPLFDSGETAGFLYYVMPYIEGETIRDRLNREGQLGVEEALQITAEVADALDYAHRHGVIHRDIKPENILLHDGRPMVMDFGIALAVSAAAGGRMTETGLSLGTPHYMSPEQATADRTITARSDVYSLASVLYEMLAGEPPHTGGTAQQIIMKIVTDVPRPVTELRKSAPPHVAAALARALEKLPADRYAGPKAFADALANPAATLAAAAQGAAPAGVARRSPAIPALAAVVVILAAALVWSVATRRPAAPPAVGRFDVSPAEGTVVAAGDEVSVALSADGAQIVYAASLGGAAPRLWLRPLDRLDARPIPGTEGATSPALSPDGATLAFVRDGQVHTMPLAGGAPPTVIAEGTDPAWGADGSLYLAGAAEGRGAIYRVPPGGGGAEAFTTPSEGYQIQPHPLPDRGGLLFTIRRSVARDSRIAFVGPEGGDAAEILSGTSGHYIATGHLVYTTFDGTLHAARFDPRTREVGPATALVSDVYVHGSSQTHVALAPSGALLYLTAPPRGEQELVWVDRRGVALPVDSSWRGSFAWPALSPDGRRLAVAHAGDVWVKQLDRGPAHRVTTDGESERPAWTPEGDSILTGSDTVAYARRADGGGEPVAVWRDRREVITLSWSPDRVWLVYRTNLNLAGTADIRAVRPGRDSAPVDLAATPALEVSPTLSPDGRWLAYASSESGRPEVRVVGFPDPSAGRWVVSTSGGNEVLWSHSGQELFYRGPDGEMVAVEVATSPTFRMGSSRVLFRGEYARGSFHRMYDVSPDDRRFIMVRQLPPATDARSRLIYVQNFVEELRRRVER